MSASTVANISLYDDGIYPWGGGSEPAHKRHACKMGVNMKVLGQKDAVAQPGDG